MDRLNQKNITASTAKLNSNHNEQLRLVPHAAEAAQADQHTSSSSDRLPNSSDGEDRSGFGAGSNRSSILPVPQLNSSDDGHLGAKNSCESGMRNEDNLLCSEEAPPAHLVDAGHGQVPPLLPLAEYEKTTKAGSSPRRCSDF